MNNILTYNEALEIYTAMQENLDRSDNDHVELFDEMISKAIRYAGIRSGWRLLTREQKIDTDESRTMAHNAFITSVNIVARLEKEAGAAWRERLSDDRKRIGDMAAFIALFIALEER